jgi:uncharacterized membrane protein SirB2
MNYVVRTQKKLEFLLSNWLLREYMTLLIYILIPVETSEKQQSMMISKKQYIGFVLVTVLYINYLT